MVSQLNYIADLSGVLSQQLKQFANAGGIIKVGAAGSGTDYIVTSTGPVIFVDQNAINGTNAENPFTGARVQYIGGAPNIIGLISHELVHFLDPTNPGSMIKVLDKTDPINRDLFVAYGLNSEARAAYNQFLIQQQVHQADPSILTTFNVTGDPSEDLQLEQQAQTSSNVQSTLSSFARAFSTASPSGGDATGTAARNYRQYYQDLWASGGGAAPAPQETDLAQATSASPIYDANGNLVGAHVHVISVVC